MPSEEPGTYVEEDRVGARAIRAVATSVAAFVGHTEKGPRDEPVRVHSLNDFEREFGSVSAGEMPAAVSHFFMNGGSTAWIVRAGGTAPERTQVADELIGSEVDGTGMYALDRVDLFNLLLVPSATSPDCHNAMVAYAERRRAFAILDLPPAVAALDQAQSWIAAAPRSPNAAAYFPSIEFADQAGGGHRRAFPNSGAVAGVYARSDAQHGVWKAPAGLEASITGAVGVVAPLSDTENGLLNPLALNAIRMVPGAGVVVWGARTLLGADHLASKWKYVPVRRTALMIEESIIRGSQWLAFEHNDESHGVEIRLSVGAFMHSLFRQGAFQGESARDAYYVQCDVDTTTAADVAMGMLNVHVGFAPVQPAEFVTLRLSLVARTD